MALLSVHTQSLTHERASLTCALSRSADPKRREKQSTTTTTTTTATATATATANDYI